MSFGNSNIDLNTTLACVDSRTGSKTLYLPSTTTIYGKYIVVKDIGGSASSNTITLNTVGGEVFENNRTFLHISTNFGFTSLVANNGKWTSLTTPYENLGDRYLISTLNITNAGFGVSSLSSIVSYGLSTVALQPAPGVSSLSSIVGYGLMNVAAGTGVSSLSSVVGYGLSTVAAGSINPGVSSLSSIVGYGLSSLGGQTATGISSLSSIVSYGLSSFIIPLSTFSTAISTRFTTSSLGANVISSTYGLFSTLSTENIIARSGEISNNLSVGSNLLVLGSIGINCNTPSYSLDIDGTAHITGDILAVGTTTLSNNQSNIVVSSNCSYTSNYVQRVAFGSDNTNLNTGVYFYNQNNQTITPTGNSSHVYDVFYNGSLWVAVGAGAGVIQTSVDGSNWSNVTMTEDNFTGYGVTYANNLWVVSGLGSYPSNPGIYTSPDGNVWTPNPAYISDGGCNYYFKAVYNSTDNYWLIPAAFAFGGSSIYYTPDPTGSNITPVGLFDTMCREVCWNGSLWVAVGLSMDYNFNVHYSSDGLVWNYALNLTNEGNQFFFENATSVTGGYGVAYGSNGVWLVVGDAGQGGPYNTIYYSTNGTEFYLINTNYESIFDIKYLGESTWVATYNTITGSSSSNGFIISSDNGSTWSNISLEDTPFGIDVSNFLQVSSNLVVTSNVIYGTSLDVYGATNLNGDLTVTGNVSLSNLAASNITTPNIITNLLTFIDQTYGSNQFLNVASNLLYFNNTIIAGSRYFKPQFITFP